MKKHLFYASLFLAALSSCSKDDDRVSTPAGEVNNDLEEIKLSVSGAEAFNVQTRGTGVVGGLEGDNKWNGQTLYVLMTGAESVDKVESKDAGYTYENMPAEILWNVAVTAPTGDDSGQVTGGTDQVHFYYPISGNYDFYGYHVDDAAFTETTTTTGEGDNVQTDTQKTPSQLKVDGNDLTLDVTIDGSQDLLVAKADWATDLEGKESEFYPNAGGYKYGAYAARRDVHPTLKFKHLLTQLQFSVENKGNNPITVTSINVTSKNTATMTVAGENFGTIAWKEATKKLEVQDKKEMVDDEENEGELKEVETETMNALNPVVLNVGDPADEIGNLLVAASGEGALITEYRGTITLQQTLDATTVDSEGALDLTEDVTVEQTIDFTIALPNAHPNFLAGHAYNVKIFVYGLSLIKVTADLTAWENGGGFEVTPEDQVNTGESATFTPTADDRKNAYDVESKKLYAALSSTEKSFGEKCDAMLAYLASGYKINPVQTRSAEDGVYDAATYGEIDFAPYADEEGNVTIKSTLTSKIADQNFTLNKGYFVEFTKESYNQLPETYREKYGEWEALESAEKSELPWLAVEFSAIKKCQLTVSVTTPDGTEITEFNGINWNKTNQVTLMTLCARELGVALTPGKWTVTVNGQSVEIEIPAPTTDEPEVEEGENTEE